MKRAALLLLTLLVAASLTLAQQPAAKQAAPAAKKSAAQKATPAATRKQIVYPPDFRPDMPFSPGVRVGGLLFVAGQTGTDPKTGKLADTFEGEVRTAIENIGIVLKAANMDYSNVLNVTVYLTDISKFPEMNKVYVQYFKADRPARATVQVAKLVGTAQFEISAIAHQ